MTAPLVTPATTDSSVLFEILGLERLVDEQEADYIAKAALEDIRRKGGSEKLVVIEVEGDAQRFELSRTCAARVPDGETVGTVTDLIWSPRLEKNVGRVWVPIELADPGIDLEIEAPDGGRWPAKTAAIPFFDPRKDTPKS
jgi:glycine cleavage system aminomethyltransferase T